MAGLGVGGNGNLIPAKPGEVRNPKGRPAGGKNRSTILKQMLGSQSLKTINKKLKAALPDDAEFQPFTIEDQMNAALVLAALSGDLAAIKEIQDTVYGKVTEKIDNTHSFQKMGDVVLDDNGEAKQIAFDIGEDVIELKAEDVVEGS